jgi:hypothetical protein
MDENLLQLPVNERPANIFPFSKMLYIMVITFSPCFASNYKLIESLFIGYVMHVRSYIFYDMWSQNIKWPEEIFV